MTYTVTGDANVWTCMCAAHTLHLSECIISVGIFSSVSHDSVSVWEWTLRNDDTALVRGVKDHALPLCHHLQRHYRHSYTNFDISSSVTAQSVDLPQYIRLWKKERQRLCQRLYKVLNSLMICGAETSNLTPVSSSTSSLSYHQKPLNWLLIKYQNEEDTKTKLFRHSGECENRKYVDRTFSDDFLIHCWRCVSFSEGETCW